MSALVVFLFACSPYAGIAEVKPTTRLPGDDTGESETGQTDTGSEDTAAPFAPARETQAHGQDEASAVLDYADDLRGPLTGAWFAGDLDGDGEGDILAWDKSSNYYGERIIILPRSVAATVDPLEGIVLDCPPNDDTYTGYSTRPSALEDLSGDGQVDLIFPTLDPAGGVWVVHGPVLVSGELVPDATVSNDSGDDQIFEAQAEDMDGDGVSDLIVKVTWARGSYTSGVYLFEGPLREARSFSDASASRVTSAGVGGEVSVADDVSGDGLPDLLVGSSSVSEEGGAWLALGPLLGAGDLSDADATLYASTNAEYTWGSAVDLPGDINGDGKGDILIGGYMASDAGVDAGGTVWLVHGAPSGTVALSDADARLHGREHCGFAGYEVTAAGDTNTDGFADFWVGAPGESYEGDCSQREGHTWLVRGPIEGRFWLPGADIDLSGWEGMGSVISAHPSDGGLLVGVSKPTGAISLFETADW